MTKCPRCNDTRQIRVYTASGWQTVPCPDCCKEKPRWLAWDGEPRRVGPWSGKGRC